MPGRTESPRTLSLLVAAGFVAAGLAACSATQVVYAPIGDAPPALGDLDAVVYLVGDAGEDSPGRDFVLGHLGRDLARLGRDRPGTPATVVYLGDNIYEVGAREAFRTEDLAKLDAQVEVLDSLPGTEAYFLPGNHDWAKGAADPSARASILRQQEWLDELAPDTSARLLPADGCPGPEVVRAGRDVHLVLFDSEWLLRLPEDDCGSEADFYARLESTLAGIRGERVVLAAHHPLVSGGPHGGNLSPFTKGPFVYWLAVRAGLGIQDLQAGRYQRMARGVRAAVRASGAVPVVFAAGHEHSLQVIATAEEGPARFQLVSGSASKKSPVRRVDGTRYASGDHGYMRLDFSRERVRLVVFAQAAPDTEVRPLFACVLHGAPGEATCPEAALMGGGP